MRCLLHYLQQQSLAPLPGSRGLSDRLTAIRTVIWWGFAPARSTTRQPWPRFATGREGYQTLLNTDLELEQDNMARLLRMAAAYKRKLGLSGPLLLEPKPQEPTKHQ